MTTDSPGFLPGIVGVMKGTSKAKMIADAEASQVGSGAGSASQGFFNKASDVAKQRLMTTLKVLFVIVAVVVAIAMVVVGRKKRLRRSWA
jgi:hypothetical protein